MSKNINTNRNADLHKDLNKNLNKDFSQKSSQQAVLECKNVYKEYFDGSASLKVLSGVELIVNRGEQVAIMGRSGSGKTTLLQMLGGLDVPTQGEIVINGHALKTLTEPELCRLRNQSLGFIYQFHHLLPEFSALENVVMPLLIANVEPKQAKERAMALLEVVGLKQRIAHRPSELSGGERQRVAIARALVNNPDCVLADEPTGNLDDESAAQVFEVMRSLNRTHNTSIVLVTHDPALAKHLDRTLILQQGQLVPKV